MAISGNVDEPVTADLFDGRTRLSFSEPIDSGKAVDYLTVRVEGPDLSASRKIYAGWEDGFEGLARYFDELVASWRGWNAPSRAG